LARPAIALVFPSIDADTGRSTYAVFARCYLNEADVAEAHNPPTPAGLQLAISS
jgi:hypothetical protein